jgi:hypothetical protein
LSLSLTRPYIHLHTFSLLSPPPSPLFPLSSRCLSYTVLPSSLWTCLSRTRKHGSLPPLPCFSMAPSFPSLSTSPPFSTSPSARGTLSHSYSFPLFSPPPPKTIRHPDQSNAHPPPIAPPQTLNPKHPDQSNAHQPPIVPHANAHHHLILPPLLPAFATYPGASSAAQSFPGPAWNLPTRKAQRFDGRRATGT